jgi:hypothetical protein
MSSEIVKQSDEDTPDFLIIEEGVNLRPDLSALGIIETERGVCEDTFENRSILRSNQLGWDTVYASNGVPTGLIMARSKDMAKQRRLLSLAEKKPIMVSPSNINSDYLSGLDLIAEPASDNLVPSWVLGATKMWVAEQDNPIATEKRKPTALPTRCTYVKDDGIRCMLWSSGRPKDSGMCRVHLRHVNKRPSDEIERARKKLVQSAPYAVDTLEELMQHATSEPVRLKASTEILDRAGVRGGIELDATVSTGERSATEIIAERLDRLRAGAVVIAGEIVDRAISTTPNDVTEAEVVSDDSHTA